MNSALNSVNVGGKSSSATNNTSSIYFFFATEQLNVQTGPTFNHSAPSGQIMQYY